MLARLAVAATALLHARPSLPLRSGRAIVALEGEEEGMAFGFGALDDETRAAIEKALDAQEAAKEAAAAAELAAAWERLIGKVDAAVQRMESKAPLSEADLSFDLADESQAASMEELKAALAADLEELATEDRVAAARALVSNRECLVVDATAPASPQLRRSIADDDARCVDAAVREASRRLLGAAEAVDRSDDYAECPGDAAIVARAAKYIARRVCSPRDVASAEAATAMRCALLQLAADAEIYAWSASGGLL